MAESAKPGTFIPHDTVGSVRAPSRGGGLNDLILLTAIVLFVASSALGAAVFLYGQFLNSQSASKVTQLQRAEAAFEPSLIHQLTRLDDRMHAADTVLRAHMGPTQFFQALGLATLQTVSFLALDYENNDPQHVVVKMQGVAQSVNSIALQADLFSKNGVITNPIFSNIARQADGVHFDLVANVNPASVSYIALIGNGTPEPSVQAPGSPFTGNQATTSPVGPRLPSGGIQ